MLNNNWKTSQAKEKKTEPDFHSILEQILNLDIQKKTNKTKSMKSALKVLKKKKLSMESLKICPYCSRPGHPKGKCYYKNQEYASKDFLQRFQNCIKEFQS